MSRSRPPALSQTVLEAFRSHSLAAPGDVVVVGVSGGPDSVCLLHVLFSLQETLGISLHVAHLDHMLRGEEAKADARFVADLAQELGVPATIEARDVEGFRRQHGLTLEEAAREVRYAFLAGVAESVGATVVVVGHTADDQAETILLHLLRGTGLVGLRGMTIRSQWRSRLTGACLTVVRPLLGISRRDTEAYCAAQGLQTRLDASNLEPVPWRNRIRRELLPLLRNYNPRVDAALLRLGATTAQYLELADDEAARHWPIVASEGDDFVRLDSHYIQGLPQAVCHHILLEAVRRLLGDAGDIEAVHIAQMAESLGKPAGKELSLPRNLYLSTDYGSVTLSRGRLEPELPPLDSEWELNIPGETALPGWQVQAEFVEARGERLGRWQADLDFEATEGRLWLRCRRPGDRFQPLGMTRPKKLQDFMVDAKVARRLRDRVPLVVSGRGVVWVVGWRIGEIARVSAQTKRIIRIQFQRS